MARAKPKAASPADLRFAAYSEAYWNLFEEALIGKCWLELPEAEHTPKNWVAHKRKALETVTEAKAKRRVPGVASPQELAAACRRVLSKLHTIDDWEDFLDRRTDEELAEFAYDTLSPKAIVRAIWALMSTI
ncbi:MAG TPA: hypothetical protein VG713_15855, partial [Pirellulales bacterium]|nr:hypothetical protein [Pirellulales bacterium]